MHYLTKVTSKSSFQIGKDIYKDMLQVLLVSYDIQYLCPIFSSLYGPSESSHYQIRAHANLSRL